MNNINFNEIDIIINSKGELIVDFNFIEIGLAEDSSKSGSDEE
jgi:hypothetical protein